jgi:streptomycin 6-kinase
MLILTKHAKNSKSYCYAIKKGQILDNLRKKLIDIYGVAAERWFKQLPELLERFQQSWYIHLLEPVPNLSYNLVYFAKDQNDGSKVIFKAGIPTPDLENEIRTLQYFAGQGCIELLRYDLAAGVMLLEQAIPGGTLENLTMQGLDDQSIYACADIIRTLHAPVVITPDLRKLTKLSVRLNEYQEVRAIINANPNKYTEFDVEYFDYAEKLFAELSATTTESVVLHGDLHHYNILSASRNPWLAIDPKGIIGDPVFEIAAFMINPLPQIVTLPNLKNLLIRRIDLFHDLLGFPKQRILDWCIAHAFLVAGQNLTSHDADWQESYTIGKMLSTITI